MISTDRISSYRIMWLFVLFDLPVSTESDRRAYTRFRNGLLDDGFAMLQFSIYMRHCASKESLEVHTNRVRSILPNQGHVAILHVTDRQFGAIEHMWGKSRKEAPKTPSQLEFF